ncbi:ABC transporter permease [Mucilaginibacter glaciei]|uniref:ABC transporter permease n=1 Tax=Mucilaginibacter glaciei TaxID=2772109 RepID=A0A926NYX8_9SPHI|nr:ABC transporter permease [Mucilaginibacter glaciei]MBD1394234.1 ABC transporter permease [Mucilaginibacter glaciei]
MFMNYLKVAWRNMVKNKVYSALNIVGLGAGIAVAMLIGMWVYYQYSYDKFIPNQEQVYQVRRNFNSNGDTVTFSSTSLKLADALRSQMPEMEYVAETDQIGSHGLVVGDTKLYVAGIQAGKDFLNIFKYPMLAGSYNKALTDIYSIILTKSTAKALFGNASPINRMVRVDNKDNLKVTAVIDDIPANSTLQFKYIIPFSYYELSQAWVKSSRTAGYGNNSFWQFVKLKQGADYWQVSRKIRDIEKTETSSVNAMNSNVIIQPMSEWHLYSDYKNGKAAGGFIEYIRMFSIIGILVLVIACINFVNLSTARFEKRAREVGVRKTIGSTRANLIWQFLTETGVITLIAFALCLLLVQLALPGFNSLTGTSIVIPFGNPAFWLAMIIGVVLVTMLAGSRPAFYLSAFNPVKVLKGSVQAGKSAGISRKLLVVVQFTCSIALIISTIVIYRQIQYAKERPTGFNVSRLLTSDMNEDMSRNYRALKNELLQSGLVNKVTTSSSPATNVYSHGDIDSWPGKHPGETVEMGFVQVSDDYFKTLGMTFKAGRDFLPNSKADSLNVIMNEAAIKRLRLTDPLNQPLMLDNKQYHIVGIVKDALVESPYQSAAPVTYVYNNGWNMIYQLSNKTNDHKAIAEIGAIFNKYNPAFPYTYRFVDDDYNMKFSEEVLVGKLSGIFAGLAILISCLGLFGMSAFVAEQRIKEIGIRKVLGAKVSQLWLLLSKDFILLVVVSCVIASPLAFYFLQNWLQKYDYRITIGPGIFILSAAIAIAITLVTISFQAIKAAIANPVKSLKTE